MISEWLERQLVPCLIIGSHVVEKVGLGDAAGGCPRCLELTAGFGDAAGGCPRCLEFNSDEQPEYGDTRETAPWSAVDGQNLLPVELTRIDKINVKLDTDTHDCHICGFVLTQDGNILLTDNSNNNIKLFVYTGQLLSSLALPADPHDVGVINSQTAAVSLAGKQIGIIDISNTGQVSLQRIISLEYYVWGISAYKNYLIVTADESSDFEAGYRSVMMVDMSGKLVWMTTRDGQGDSLFERAHCLAVRRDLDCDTIIVTDENQETITILDAPTGEEVKVIDSEGKTPCGVTVDNRGNICVCHDSGEVSMWSSDMEEEQCLAIGNVEYPHAMVYNQSRSELIISSLSMKPQYSDYIYRYRLQ